MTLREVAWGAMLGETGNILVGSDEWTDQATICKKLFEGTPSPHAIVVSYEQSVEDWLSDYQHSAFESVVFVSVGETVRSTAATTPAESMTPPGPFGGLVFEGIGDPGDLAALGLTIRSHLEAFDESGQEGVVVCFDSLSGLLKAVSIQQAFRFLHILRNLISAYDATAHYHSDSDLTARELETLRPLFDAEFGPRHSHGDTEWILESSPRRSAVK